MKPLPLGNFIPPVTGAGGRPSFVSANLFDSSNMFRSRSNSKRARTETEFEGRFDLTRDFPELVVPDRQPVDLKSVEALLVGVAEVMPNIRAKLDDPNAGQDIKDLAGGWVKLYELVECVCEKVLRPAAASNQLAAFGGARPPPVPPKPDAERIELVEALRASERVSILYDADLGGVPTANRQKLCQALSVGLRNMAVERAVSEGGDPAEAVRVADDALSMANDMAFLGQATAPGKDKPYHTLPIKLEFEDASSRIHFERTMRARCGLRATMSLPRQVRDSQKKFFEKMKETYPDEIVIVRIDINRLRFTASHKRDGGPKWVPCPEWEDIPVGVLRGGGPGAGSSSGSGTGSAAGSGAGSGGAGGGARDGAGGGAS